MYKNILLDLDGTLTDSAQGITNSVKYALRYFGFNVEDTSTLLKFIGPPLYDSFRGFYNLSHEEGIKAVEVYREYFKDKGIYENKLYPDIVTLLSELQKLDKRIILATSKPQEFSERIISHFHLDSYFDDLVGATFDGTLGKKEHIITEALKKNNLIKAETVMVGDRFHDIQGAKVNGIDSIGVSYGYGSEEELMENGATYIAHTPLEILKYV